jgi:hypothetical protein
VSIEVELEEGKDLSNVVPKPLNDLKVFSRELQGLIFVADDQHINLEILDQHMGSLELQAQCRYFINGQQVIDAVTLLLTEFMTKPIFK